jgi:hypothetical protein
MVGKENWRSISTIVWLLYHICRIVAAAGYF